MQIFEQHQSSSPQHRQLRVSTITQGSPSLRTSAHHWGHPLRAQDVHSPQATSARLPHSSLSLQRLEFTLLGPAPCQTHRTLRPGGLARAPQVSAGRKLRLCPPQLLWTKAHGMGSGPLGHGPGSFPRDGHPPPTSPRGEMSLGLGPALHRMGHPPLRESLGLEAVACHM